MRMMNGLDRIRTTRMLINEVTRLKLRSWHIKNTTTAMATVMA